MRLDGLAATFRIMAIYVLLIETTRLLGLTFLRMFTMKHNRDLDSKSKLLAAQGKLMWEPLEYPESCFFKTEKPFENVCATEASPVQLRKYLFLHLFDCKPQNIVAVVQQLKKLYCWMEW